MTRERWDDVKAFGFFALVVVGLTVALGPWVLVFVAGAIVWLVGWWRLKRAWQLRRRGYFGGRSASKPGYRSVWIYEELQGTKTVALELELDHVEPGRWELWVPAEEEWARLAPPWAQNRRDEIIERIAESFPPDRIRREAGPGAAERH